MLDPLPLPPVVGRTEWQHARDQLLAREKAHTREGDAIAAARRSLPMTPVARSSVIGVDGPTPLVDVFEGRRMLIAYCFMWHQGLAVDCQCEGCTLSQSQISDAVPAYLAERDVTYAVFSEGPWEEISSYQSFMGWTMPWYSTSPALDNPALSGGGPLRCYLCDGDNVYLTYETNHRGTEVLDTALRLLDMTAYGRQETWEESPPRWPQVPAGSWWRRDGRPVAQWARTSEPAANDRRKTE